MKGTRAKAKANAAQVVKEMMEIATDKRYNTNNKEKYREAVAKG